MKFLKIIIFILKKKLNKNFIKDFNLNEIKYRKRALLYYKLPFYNFLDSKCGTTEHQSLTLAKTLNDIGYVVTVVDKGSNPKLKEKYDIFLGIFNTGSAIYFNEIKNKVKLINPKATLIGLATGANPLVMKKEYEKRKRNFFLRNKINISSDSRYNKNISKKDFSNLNGIIYFGYKKGYVEKSFPSIKKKYPIQSIIDLNKIKKKDIINKKIKKKNFLFFSGSGHLLKGLDIAIESILDNKDLKLTVCALNDENQLTNSYDKKLLKRINFVGKIDPYSNFGKKIFQSCNFILSPNCSGGSAAALAVARNFGLIPVVSKNEDCNTTSAIVVGNDSIKSWSHTLNRVSRFSDKKLKKLMLNNFDISQENSEINFCKKSRNAILNLTTTTL
jgi:glycosyltransferase involved in cell wall biosynthesis